MTPAQEHDALLASLAAYEQGVLGLSPKTVDNHRTYLSAFLRWWCAARATAAVATATPADVADFLIAESDRGVASSRSGHRCPVATVVVTE